MTSLMFVDLTKLQIYLHPEATDMRKSINGLSLIVQEVMNSEAGNGNLYLFLNGKRNIIKILYWETNGFCLWQKRLEKHKFPWPKTGETSYKINLSELKWLLEGVDFFNKHTQVTFSKIG